MNAKNCEYNEGYCRDENCKSCNNKKENLKKELSNDNSWLRTVIKDFRPYRNRTNFAGLR